MNRIPQAAAWIAALAAMMSFASIGYAADHLPSWNVGAAKQATVFAYQ